MQHGVHVEFLISLFFLYFLFGLIRFISSRFPGFHPRTYSANNIDFCFHVLFIYLPILLKKKKKKIIIIIIIIIIIRKRIRIIIIRIRRKK